MSYDLTLEITYYIKPSATGLTFYCFAGKWKDNPACLGQQVIGEIW